MYTFKLPSSRPPQMTKYIWITILFWLLRYQGPKIGNIFWQSILKRVIRTFWVENMTKKLLYDNPNFFSNPFLSLFFFRFYTQFPSCFFYLCQVDSPAINHFNFDLAMYMRLPIKISTTYTSAMFSVMYSCKSLHGHTYSIVL